MSPEGNQTTKLCLTADSTNSGVSQDETELSETFDRFDLFFDFFNFSSQTHDFREEKHITMPHELANFLMNSSFTDLIPYFGEHFSQKGFFWIHSDRIRMD